MPRIALFEFEDQRWFPAVLRNAVTGYLRLVTWLTRQVDPVIPAVENLLRESGETQIVDLCSGSGGVAARLAEGLAAAGTPVPVLLTDLYPDTAAFAALRASSTARLEFRTAPLDAARVPADLPGVRTMFNAFHHFEPEIARGILADAASAQRPIAVIEFVERSFFALSGVLMSPFLVLLVAPFLRPLRAAALFFTYLVPLVPLVLLWDGAASWLRVYSLAELRALADSVASDGYTWEAGHWRLGPTRVTYLIGRPLIEKSR